jgi:RimJ/RimL family protein N-acetyltransferase
MTTFPLLTERLTLRHFHMEDVEVLHRSIFGDAEVMLFGDGVQTHEWVHAWVQNNIQQYEQQGFGAYAVVEKNSQGVIGYCGLFHFPDVNGKPEMEIGYRLARAAWGHGYAAEATRVLRDYAFTTLGLQRLIAMIDPANTASVRVAEKLGMHHEQDVMFEGYSHPDHVYAMARP